MLIYFDETAGLYLFAKHAAQFKEYLAKDYEVRRINCADLSLQGELLSCSLEINLIILSHGVSWYWWHLLRLTACFVCMTSYVESIRSYLFQLKCVVYIVRIVWYSFIILTAYFILLFKGSTVWLKVFSRFSYLHLSHL